MTYLKWMTAGLLAVSLCAAGCDSDKKKAATGDDAGADTAAPSKEPEAADDRADASAAPGAGEARPTATASEKGTIDEKPPLDIEGVLPVEVVTKIAGGGNFEAEKLVGVEPSPTYNARRIKPAGGGNYGAGLQVWSFDKADGAGAKLSTMKSQYLNVSKAPDSAKGLGDAAFVAERSGIRNLVFAVDEPACVAAVSCSKEVCSSDKELVQLATAAQKKLAARK
jgi:hypothetical protein